MPGVVPHISWGYHQTEALCDPGYWAADEPVVVAAAAGKAADTVADMVGRAIVGIVADSLYSEQRHHADCLYTMAETAHGPLH